MLCVCFVEQNNKFSLIYKDKKIIASEQITVKVIVIYR